MGNPWHPAASAVLVSGERLLAAEQVRLAGGTSPGPPPPPPAAGGKRMGPVGRLVTGVLNIISPNLSLPGQDRLENLIFGVGAAGRPGSRAGDLFHAHLHHPGLTTTVLVVTDQRVLLTATAPAKLFSLAEPGKDHLDVLWEVPRDEVSGARIERYRLRKRLRVSFTDGSWGAFLDPPADTGSPVERLAAAFAES